MNELVKRIGHGLSCIGLVMKPKYFLEPPPTPQVFNLCNFASTSCFYCCRNVANKENRIEKRWPCCIQRAARVTLVFEMNCTRRMDMQFVETSCSLQHTSKSGAPSSKAAECIMKEIEDVTNDHPELSEKTIEQGDLFSHVLGKERNGYVRSVGLGPSATDLPMKGYNRLPSTKLQMAEKEAKEALRENAHLREGIDQIENDTNTKVAALMEEIQEMRKMIASGGRKNVESSPPYDSNSPIHENMRADIKNSVGEPTAAGKLDVQELLAIHKEAARITKKKEAAALL